MPVPELVAFTLAPATTAPDGSVTVPLMAPRNVWAFPATASRASAIKIPSIRLISLLQQNLNILAQGWVQVYAVACSLKAKSLTPVMVLFFSYLQSSLRMEIR